jgi:hypothetical protein
MHTPAPWTVERTNAKDFIIRHEDGGITSHVARLYDMALCEEHGDIESNARLIAAAPELLDALKLMCEAVREHHLLNVKTCFSLSNATAAASKAIYHATEEQ